MSWIQHTFQIQMVKWILFLFQDTYSSMFYSKMDFVLISGHLPPSLSVLQYLFTHPMPFQTSSQIISKWFSAEHLKKKQTNRSITLFQPQMVVFT